MAAPTPPFPPDPNAPQSVTPDHLKAAVEAGIGPLKTELRWQRYVVGLLCAVAFGPKIGSLPVAAVITSDPQVGPHLVGLLRYALGL